MYGQIVRWFQNHSYMERKSCGEKSTKKKSLPIVMSVHDDEDEETVKCHLKELEREVKKKQMDDNKVSRLLSLTYASRRESILSHNATTRVAATLEQYSCLKKPIYVRYSCCGLLYYISALS